MTFAEFRVAIRLISTLLGIDQLQLDHAIKFGDVLSNPLIFSRFCKASKMARKEEMGHMEAPQTLPPYEECMMHSHELGNLLQTFRISPHLISNAQAGCTFKIVLRNYHASLVNAKLEKQEESGPGGDDVQGRTFLQKLKRGGMQAHGLPYEWYLHVMSALAARQKISNVLSIRTLCSTYTRSLTFENLCQHWPQCVSAAGGSKRPQYRRVVTVQRFYPGRALPSKRT
jgi:hypothetical protein